MLNYVKLIRDFVNYDQNHMVLRKTLRQLPGLIVLKNIINRFSSLSLSTLTAGFIAVLVGFTSSAVLVFQAATMLGADAHEISSWLFALGLSMAITCIGLSLRYKMPILTGWSTAGAAFLVTSLSHVHMPEAIGAFMFSAALTCVFGFTGLLERIMIHIPRSLSAAMLAGILIHFGMNIFIAMQTEFSLVCAMCLAYLLAKRFLPRYTMILVLLVGVIITQISGKLELSQVHWTLSLPVFTMPVFTLSTIISIGIPLFVVTMTSQNIPGVSVLNNAGYTPPISPVIGFTGLVNVLLAPFGSYSISLAAMTAAICADPSVDSNPNKRYKATLFAGLFWLLIGLFGATFVALFLALPKAFLLAVAGLALIGTISQSISTAVSDESSREPAIITLLVAASGMSLFGIGSAFWGIIAGIIASFCLKYKPKALSSIPVMSQ